MKEPVISVVIATYNRAPQLQETLRSLFDQRPDTVPYEVIVVDNNCTDDTPAVVRAMQSTAGSRLRYVQETRQGNAHARNTGIHHATASIIAFTDDDVLVAADWVQRIAETFRDEPASGFIGGPVLPVWDGRPPEWLTRDSWAPVAAMDYGPAPFEISGGDPRCLLAANLAIRREVLDRVGVFTPTLQRVKDSIGSLEDHELITRLCDAGERGLYVPAVVAYTTIIPERLSKDYHRRWHRGHGRFFALLHDRQFEQSRVRVLGSPAHVYRQAVNSAGGWLRAALSRNPGKAFAEESRFWFAVGFIRERLTFKHAGRR